ncbi:MAG TPA: hypothetical protein PLZ57_10030 [Pseudobdellovibrionaceae bacterium]|nr:hypothetical protein [Pseudobdellovibrionaceae bacterium]
MRHALRRHFQFAKLLSTLTMVAIAVLAGVSSSPSAFAAPYVEQPPWGWRKASFGFGGSTRYTTTQANYGPGRGEFTRLTGDNQLTAFETNFRGRYAFWPKFSMYAGGAFSQVRAIDSVNEKTNNGLTEINAGGHFVVWRNWLIMIAEVQGGIAMSKNTRLQTAPLLHDGVSYAQAVLHMRKNIGRTRWIGHVGANFPSDGFAKKVLYGFVGELPIGDAMLIGGGVEGYDSMITDELTESERNLSINAANAGSQIFAAWDPAQTSFKVYAGFLPGRTVDIRAGYQQSFTGLRAPHAQTFFLSLNFGSVPRRGGTRVTTPPGIEPVSPNDQDGFRLDNEKTDRTIFTPEEDGFEPARIENDLRETERLLDGK